MVINLALRDLDCACQTDNNMAETIEPSPAKRPRKPNFTPAECEVIFEEAEENLSIIKSKFSSTLWNKNKSRVWEEITSKVNALGVCKRSVAEVKEKWRGMLSSARKEHNNTLSHETRQGEEENQTPQKEQQLR